MPQRVTRKFELTGWATVTLLTEQEMCDALRLDRKRLREAIKRGQLTYSAHPLATHNKEYEFSPESLEQNVRMWACLQAGGHHFEFEKYYDENLRKAKYKCTTCPAEKYD